MERRWRLALKTLMLAGMVLAAPASAANLRDGFTETTIASGLASPTAMAFAPDGRLFVAQQGGALRVIRDGALLPAPFLSLTVSAVGERGLLGLAFDPQFTTNHFVYVYYTATTPTIHNRVSRFTANGDVAVTGSEVVLLDLPTLSATNHNGGALHFGIDGLLYIAVGENAVAANAQSLNTPLGKMLRIDRNGAIPANNPFVSQTTGINRAIWAMGLRNPFTFAFEPASGRLLINDVGENTWEEIDEGIAGANYGWPATEGPTSDPRFVSPLYAYSHAATGGCAIAGAAFYPILPSQFPSSYAGDYFFADLCAGWIRRHDFTSGIDSTDFASGISAPVDLAIGPEGGLYYLARGAGSSTGTVIRIDYTPVQALAITQQPADVTALAGQSVTFAVAASGAPPLAYQWRRNGTAITGAVTTSYMLTPVTVADDGARFDVIVSNGAGSVTSSAATLTVKAVGGAPVPRIRTPLAGARYVAGGTIAYSGSASDPEDGVLPTSRFTWKVDVHRETETRSFLGPLTGSSSGSFVVPDTGETSANVWYRIHLTVTDSSGQQASTFVDIRPRTVTITFRSNPSGLGLILDGQAIVTPLSVTSVVGMRHTIGARSVQTHGDLSYELRSWSDRGAGTHEITTPTWNTTFTATFRRRVSPTVPPDGPQRFAVPRPK